MIEPQIRAITQNVRLLQLHPPIPGYDEFIGPYLLSDGQAAVIDIGPAVAVPSFLAALAKTNISRGDINYIIFTHIHIDHAGAAGTAIKELPNAKILAHSRAREHLINPKALWEASLKNLGDYAARSGPMEPVPQDRIIDVIDGMKVSLGPNLEVELYLTPGHAAHHLCVFIPANGILFSGEAAGVCINGAVRLATPPPFKLNVTLSSIDKLIDLKPVRLCYSHFGCYNHGIERLKLYRQKVAEWYEIVNEEVEKGKDISQIMPVLRTKDKELNYLDRLDTDKYSRELSLIYNSIRGLSEGRLI